MKKPVRIHLVEERKNRKWSQQEVADRLGTTQHNVSRWERGQTAPGSYFRTRLCELFGKQPQELGLFGDQVIEDPQPTAKPIDANTSRAGLEKRRTRWYVPHQRNAFFAGRDHLLHSIHALLQPQDNTTTLTRSLALHGLGGIGKTQVALEYVYRYASAYTTILWISAETSETLLASFVSCADILALPEQHPQDPQKLVQAMLQWLGVQKDWLLVFDNVEDLALLQAFLPVPCQGALLLTTRLQAVGTLARRIPVNLLNTEESLTLLLQRAKLLPLGMPLTHLSSTDVLAAQAIVEIMDGLPLALDQAGAYIEETQCSLGDYLYLLQTVSLRLLDERDAYAEHPLSVTKTFVLACEQVERHHTLATALLTACAFLAPEAIPETFFLEGAASLGAPFDILATDPLQLHSAMKALLAYSLLQRDPVTHTLTIHRLVQVVLRGRQSEAAQHAWVERLAEAMSRVFPLNNRQVGYWPTCAGLLPHALVCLKLSEQWQMDTTKSIPLMVHVATYFGNLAQFSEAERLYQRALDLIEHASETKNPLSIQILRGLANLYLDQGAYEQAKHLYEHAVQAAEHEMSLDLASSLNNLALVYIYQGKYQEAEPLYQRALRIKEHILGPEHVQVASSLNNLGILYMDLGKDKEAEALFQRALRLCEQTLGYDDIQGTFPMSNLAELFERQEKDEEAEALCQRALRIREDVLGPEHPMVAEILNDLATFSRKRGKYEEAEVLCRQALRIYAQHGKDEHPDVASILVNLARLYVAQNRYDEAIPYYANALQMRTRLLGSTHHLTAETARELADCAIAQRKDEI